MSYSNPTKRIRSGLFPRRTRSSGSGTTGSLNGGITPPLDPSSAGSVGSASSRRSQPQQPPSNQQQEPKWMDWVATGVEWLGCEAVTSTPKPTSTSSSTTTPTPEETALVAQLHEDFLDALLQEQANLSATAAASRSSSTMSCSPGGAIPPQREDSFNTQASTGSSTTNSLSSESSSFRSHYSSFSSIRTRKPRRYARHHSTGTNSSVGGGSSISSAGTGSANSYRHSMNALEEYQRNYAGNSTPTTPNATTATTETTIAARLPLDPIREKDSLPLPPELMDVDCVLQKDRGKGEPLGSAVKANGKDACLMKLREKMAIVAQVSTDSKSAWKRRPAVVTKATSEYIETRSMMELRLGFLSMQYGLLLHWKRTGSDSSIIINNNNKTDAEIQGERPKIVFVVLRKMCHDSFYKVKKSSHHHHHHTTSATRHHHHHRSTTNHQHRGSTPGTSATRPSSMKRQLKLVPIRHSPTDGNGGGQHCHHHDAIWEGTTTMGDAEVLWLEPVPNIPPSTLHVTVASVKLLDPLAAGTAPPTPSGATAATTGRLNTPPNTRWTLSFTMEDAPSQILSWSNSANGGEEPSDMVARSPSISLSSLEELSTKTLQWPGLTKPCDVELRLLKQSPQDKYPTIVANRTLPLTEWMSQPHPQTSKQIQLRMTLASTLQLTLQFTYESDQAVIWYQTLEKMNLYDADGRTLGEDGMPDLESVSSSSQTSEPESYFDRLCGWCFRDDTLC